MFVVMIASECAPVAQAGGLGQVIFGLSRELELRGHAVEIILPKYDCMRYDQIFGLSVAYPDLWVPWYSGSVHCTVWFGFVHGRKCFFLEPHSPDLFFGRGHLYGSADDVARFAFLSKAALEFVWKSGKRPEAAADRPLAAVPGDEIAAALHRRPHPPGSSPVIMRLIDRFSTAGSGDRP